MMENSIILPINRLTDSQKYSLYMRELLVMIVNLSIAIMMVFIFPSQYYEDSNLYITLTMLTAIFFTYAFLFMMKVSHSRVVIILHSLTFVNILIAAVLVDIIFFDLVMLSLFYVLTRILLTRTEGILEKIESYLYLMYQVSIIGIWMIKDVDTELYLTNFLLSQLLVGLIYIQRINQFTPDFLKLSPFVMNLLAIPLLRKFTVPDDHSIFETLPILTDKFDFNMLILLVFTLSFLLRHVMSSVKLNSGYYILSILMILQAFFYGSDDEFTGFNSLQLVDLNLDLFNAVFTAVLVLMVLETRKSLNSDPTIVLSLAGAIIFYTIVNSQEYTESVILDVGVIGFAILLLGLLCMRTPEFWSWQFPLQGALILIQQIGNENYIEWVGIALHTGYFIEFAWLSLKFKENIKFDYFLALPMCILIIEWIIGSDQDVYRLQIWVELALTLGYMLLALRPVASNRNLAITYSVSLFIGLLSFDSIDSADYFSGLSPFEVGVILYSAVSAILFLRSKNSGLDHNLIASQGLLIFVVLFHNFGEVSEYQQLVLLTLLPLVNLKNKITNRDQMINTAIHFSGFIVYCLVYSNDILFVNSKILNSALLIGFVALYIYRISPEIIIQKDFITILTSVFGVFAIINIIMQNIETERLAGIPYQTVLLLISLSPFVFKQAEDGFKQFVHLMVSVSFAALYLLPHQEILRYDETISTSVLVIQEKLVLDSYFIFLLTFVIISSYLVLKANSENLQNLYGIDTFSLLIFLTIFYDTGLENSSMPVLHLILVQIVIYLVFAFTSRKIDRYLVASFVSLLIIFIADGTDPRIYLELSDTVFSLTIISFIITPIVFTLLAMRDREYQVNLKYMAVVFGVLILFAIVAELSVSSIPQELYFLNLLLLIVPIIYSEKQDNSFWYFMLVGLYEVCFLALEKKPSIIKVAIFEEFYFITSVLFFVVECIMLYTLIRTDNEEAWHIAFAELLFRILLINTMLNIVDPLTISVIILLYGLPLILQSTIFSRTYTPLYQAGAIILISIKHGHAVFMVGSFPFSHVLYGIWTVLLLVVWYRKGIDVQLQSSVIAVFAVSLGILLVNNEFDTMSRILLAILPMIITLIIGLLFYDRQTSETRNFVIVAIAIIMVSTLGHYLNAKQQLDGSEEIIIRLIMDWFIFLPLVLEIILYVKPQLDNMYAESSTAGTADFYIAMLLVAFTLISLIMGSEEIFVTKLLFIALGFWVLSGIFIRDALAWMISIYTVFVMGFMLYQMGDPEEATGAANGLFTQNYTLYFLGMAIVGAIMLMGAVINEKRYVKEPFTMSLSVTGSILTAVAIIVPAYQNSPFPFANEDLSVQIVNFLPNVVWAVQGLSLFLLARSLKKEYLSRLSFGILILDIAKTLIDILTGAENPLIRIIGSISVGIVCVFIFYVFSKEESSSIENI